MSDKTKNILLTGATGFLGNHLLPILSQEFRVHTLSHRQFEENASSAPISFYSIHLGGLAHRINPKFQDFYEANVQYTEKFLSLSKARNVQHFIFVSSIKAMGEGRDSPYSELSSVEPEDDYGKTKLIAEDTIKLYCLANGINYTIIRPPLLYGRNPKANMKSLIQHIAKGLPVPISSGENKRSILSTSNLVDFLLTCLRSPLSRNQTFLVQDPHPISTRELSQWIAEALNRPLRIIPIPNGLGSFLFGILGKKSAWNRLAGSLYVDDKYTRKTMNWNPPQSTKEGIIDMIQNSTLFNS